MDDWYCQILALNKVNIQGKYNMKTLLTLLLLLSSNIIFAGDAGSAAEPEEMKLYKGALGDIFDLGMTDQDTGTQTTEFKRLYLIDIDEGRDLYQVQLALAYSARDTALLEKKYAEKGELTDKEDALIQDARNTTRAIAYMAVASKVHTAMKNAEGVEFADYSAYIDSVNIYGEEDFMTETAFSVLKSVGQNIAPIDVAIFYRYYTKDVFKNANVAAAKWYLNKGTIRQTNDSSYAGNEIQTMLMNLGQSIYTSCVSCPKRSE